MPSPVTPSLHHSSPAVFHRLHPDGTSTPAPLHNAFAGPTPTACWLIGGGPSLASLPTDAIARSPLPKMSINLAGTRLLRPTFWTSYDPSARFHRSVYLDPSILKFVHRRRSMDLIPETTFKVCEAPATFFFDRDPQRGFADFLSSSHTTIVDWADSFVQAIDLLYHLGFRTLYLAGCELRIHPSPAQLASARLKGVEHNPHGRLDEWLNACRKAGLTDSDLDLLDPAPQYHFDESKPIAAAASTDLHYFRIAQYLRLSRRALTLAGLQLISVTPDSRLNDYFPFAPVESVLAQITETIGNPATEPTRGLYRQTTPRPAPHLGPMRDYRPHNWPPRKPIPTAAQAASTAPHPVPNGNLVPLANANPRPTAPVEPDLLIECEGPQLITAHDPIEHLRNVLDSLPADLRIPDEQPQ